MNKDLEIYHVDGFRSVYEYFPEGDIITSESPDFLIITTSGKIGIEHKQVFKEDISHGSSLQAQENIQKRIINQTKVFYEEAKGVPISVYFVFNEDHKILTNAITELSKDISNTLLTKSLRINEQAQIYSRDISSPHHDAILFLFLHRGPGLITPNFSPLRMGWESELTPERIEDEIKEKEAKINQYRQICQKIWLLLVADDFTNASSVSLSSEAQNYTYTTSFDRVFFYWSFDQVYVELYVD